MCLFLSLALVTIAGYGHVHVNEAAFHGGRGEADGFEVADAVGHDGSGNLEDIAGECRGSVAAGKDRAVGQCGVFTDDYGVVRGASAFADERS